MSSAEICYTWPQLGSLKTGIAPLILMGEPVIAPNPSQAVSNGVWHVTDFDRSALSFRFREPIICS